MWYTVAHDEATDRIYATRPDRKAFEEHTLTETDKSRELAVALARALDGKKGRDIVILDVSGVTVITDYFVICSGVNTRQAKALLQAVQEEAKSRKRHAKGIEGRQDMRWILADLGDVVAHIFDPDARAFYDLELLWGDAPKVEWEAQPQAPGQDRAAKQDA